MTSGTAKLSDVDDTYYYAVAESLSTYGDGRVVAVK
jgi:hypothetical protein